MATMSDPANAVQQVKTLKAKPIMPKVLKERLSSCLLRQFQSLLFASAWIFHLLAEAFESEHVFGHPFCDHFSLWRKLRWHAGQHSRLSRNSRQEEVTNHAHLGSCVLSSRPLQASYKCNAAPIAHVNSYVLIYTRACMLICNQDRDWKVPRQEPLESSHGPCSSRARAFGSNNVEVTFQIPSWSPGNVC